MTLAMHCARPRTEANYRCDVSFERPLITSCPRTRSYASRERKLWWKKFKIKRFVSGCDEIWDSRSIEEKDKLSTDPLTAILASLDHFYGIYGSSSWNGRLQSPWPSHVSYCKYNSKPQTSIKRLPNGSRGEETVNNKTQTQGKSLLFLFFVQNWNLSRVLFIIKHSLINSKSNELPQVWAACG